MAIYGPATGTASLTAGSAGQGGSIDTMHGEDVVGKIDFNGNNGREVIFMKELMKRLPSPSLHPVAANRNSIGERLASDGEVPFIR